MINRKANISPAFQQVFFTTMLLTLLSGGTSIWMADQRNLSSEQNRVFETCNTTWSMGVGAIFGLLGSKAADLFHTDDDEEEKK